MSLYDYVEFSESFALPEYDNLSKERFQTHDWTDSLSTIYVDRHGRLWSEKEVLRQNTTEDTTSHSDPRLGGFNAAAEPTPAWKRIRCNSTIEIVGEDERHTLIVSDGIVQAVE